MQVLNRALWRSAAAATVFLCSVGLPQAEAHDVVLHSNPSNGGVVESFPTEIALEFSGEVQEGFNTVALSRADGDSVDVLFSGEPEVSGRDVTLTVPEDLKPEPGDYKVGFQIISSDGHSTKGMTTFTFAPAGGSQSPAAPADASAPSGQGSDPTSAQPAQDTQGMSILLGALAGLALVGVVVAKLARRKRVDGTEHNATNRD